MQLKISNKTGGNRSFQFLIVVLSFFNVAQCQRQQTHQYNPNSFNQQTNNAIGDTDYEYQDLPPATAAPTAKYSGPIGSSSSNKHRQSVVASASNSQKVTPPVAILKQINRHNEDGSYTYGFEGADGSFKIETKSAQGEVTGKYGYVDDSGKVRVVEYGANKYGFRPSGEGITVPPPVIINEADAKYEEDGEEEEVGHRHAPPPPPRKSQQQQPQQASLFQAAASKQRKQQNHHGYVPATTGVNRPPAQIATGYDDNVSPNIFRQENGQQSFAGGGNFNAPSPAYNYQNKIPKRLELPTDEEIGDNFAPSSQLPTAAFQHSNHQSRGQQQSPLPAGNRPSFGNAYPAPVIESQPDLYSPLAAASSRASHGRRQESGGVLEQLLKQYSLPPNGSPAIHDTSYGIY